MHVLNALNLRVELPELPRPAADISPAPPREAFQRSLTRAADREAPPSHSRCDDAQAKPRCEPEQSKHRTEPEASTRVEDDPEPAAGEPVEVEADDTERPQAEASQPASEDAPVDDSEAAHSDDAVSDDEAEESDQSSETPVVLQPVITDVELSDAAAPQQQQTQQQSAPAQPVAKDAPQQQPTTGTAAQVTTEQTSQVVAKPETVVTPIAPQLEQADDTADQSQQKQVVHAQQPSKQHQHTQQSAEKQHVDAKPVAESTTNTTTDTTTQSRTQTGEQSPDQQTANNTNTPTSSAQPVAGSAAANVTTAPTVDHATAAIPTGPTTAPTQPAGANPQGAAALPESPAADQQSQQADQLNAARLARGLQNALQQRGGAVTLRLTPPEMGTVRIHMQMHGTTVTAQFHAESESARTMLSTQLAQLRHALEGQGLSVDRLSVQTMQHSSSSMFDNQSDESAAEGRSRGAFAQRQSTGNDEPFDENSAEPGAFEQLVLNEQA